MQHVVRDQQAQAQRQRRTRGVEAPLEVVQAQPAGLGQRREDARDQLPGGRILHGEIDLPHPAG